MQIHRTFIRTLIPSILGIWLLGSTAASADRGVSTTKELPQKDRGGAIVGAKIGGLLAQPFSPLGATYFVELEAGYLLPMWRRLFALTLSGSLANPGTSGGGADPRLPGGLYTYEVKELQGTLGLTLSAKIPLGRVVPYLGIGPRIFLVQTTSTAQAGGVSIPETVETSTEFGMGLPIGLDILLGPGRLFGEGQFLYSPTNQRSTGVASLGSITLAVGYRLVL